MNIIKTTRIFGESILFALQALRSNLLRTTLSLLGVTVGIFAIVTVFTIVDSLEKTLREDMSFIGEDVMYVQRFPWQFGEGEYPWWEYFRRPLNTIEEFRFLEKNITEAEGVALFLFRGNMTVRHRSNSMSGALLQGSSFGLNNVRDVLIEQGRYFTLQEMEAGRKVSIIGSDIAEALFPYQSPIGKELKIKGQKFKVIGVMEREGSSIFGDTSNDIRFIVPYKAFGKLYVIGKKGVEPTIALKGSIEDAGLLNLENEVRGLMRTKRGLKPIEEDNFALNRSEMFSDAITSLFGVFTFAGGLIGSFSILVGGFGIANIMFVSVRERTNLIGIQKSLGAKNYFILSQFLFEAIFLSMIGGLVGIILTYGLTQIPQDFLNVVLYSNNIILGMSVAGIVGVVSGILPAISAARMNPVEAIRAK